MLIIHIILGVYFTYLGITTEMWPMFAFSWLCMFVAGLRFGIILKNDEDGYYE